MPIRIKMRSSSNLVKGQGVGSCFDEQLRLVSEGLSDNFSIEANTHTKADVVHYHTVNLNYYLEALMKNKCIATIGYVHFLPDTLDESLNIPKFFRKTFYNYLLAFYNEMDYLVTVNPCIIKKLYDYNINKPKILYIPNFVSDDDFFEKSEEEKLDLRKKYGIEPKKFVVLCAGQLQRRKGIFDFVKVAQNMPEVQFIWAGGFSFGKISDGYEEIKKILENPPDNMKFLGIIDRKEMVDVYNIADIFFLPSFDELFPMTILEAVSCKKPILLRDVELYENILFDYYLKAKDIDGFVKIISDIQNNHEMAALWKEKSWNCHKRYSKESILKMWENLYVEAYARACEKSILRKGEPKHEKIF